MDDTFFGVLYRNGPEEAPNSIYSFMVDNTLTFQQKGILRLEFVKRYDNLSGEKMEKIVKEVATHTGPQEPLLRKIEEVLKN